MAQRNILNSNWILVLKVFFSTFIWRCLTLAGIKLPTKFCQKQMFGFPLQFAVDIHSINRINTYILDDPWFFKCFFFLSFFFFCQNVTWNFHTSLFMKLCNQISKEIHAHKLFWFSASNILAYHWLENSKNICVVSMLFTQANSFILRCNEQYILQGMPNKQDQQSQTNMSFTHICV